MTTMISARSLRGYRPLVRDLGGDAVRLLSGSGIEPTALDQLTAFISFEDMIALLERSATELRCSDFGLRLAERQDVGVLGTLAVAMRYSATVGEAARCASRYLHTHSPGIAFTVIPGERAGHTLLAFDLLLEQPPPWPQTAEHAVGLAWHILRMFSEGRCHLVEVRFPHRPLGPYARYRSRFPAPVIFEATRLALVISTQDLELPGSDHHEELQAVATRYLQEQLSGSENACQVQVRQAVEALLGTGTCSQSQVASALYMHPRTLQRRLREEGTSFEEIKDNVRRDLAQRYLSRPDVPLSQVTDLLDYGEESTLGRSCRRWFNTSPRTMRARLLAGSAA